MMVYWWLQICLAKGENMRKEALYSSFEKKKPNSIHKTVKVNLIKRSNNGQSTLIKTYLKPYVQYFSKESTTFNGS